MYTIDELVEIYERKSKTGWGSGELMLWVQSAYKALKECSKKNKATQTRLWGD